MNAATSQRLPALHYIVFVVIAVGGCAADLLTKYFIFRWRGMPSTGMSRDVWWLCEPYIGIETALNPGALFGIGAGFRPIFITASVIALAWIAYWAFGRPRAARDLWFAIPLAMISGGILGNLYDRLGLWHPPGKPGVWRTEVRDWILFQHPKLPPWPNFNIADSLLVCGVGFLMLRAFFVPAPASSASKPAKK